jgi:hypothetical protein
LVASEFPVGRVVDRDGALGEGTTVDRLFPTFLMTYLD